MMEQIDPNLRLSKSKPKIKKGQKPKIKGFKNF